MNLLSISRRLALVVVLTLVAACGSGDETESAEAAGPSIDDGSSQGAGSPEDDAESTGDTPATYPVDVDTAAGVVTIGAAPTKIVSLSPTATEILFAIGAGDLVAAVDLSSDYPPEAPEGTLDGFTPDLEAILATETDLVVASSLPEEVATGLTENDIPVLFQPAAGSFDDTYDQVAQLGEATGQLEQAAAVNAEIRQGIDDVVATLPETGSDVRVFHEIDDSFYTATSNSFIGQVYATLGFENVADPLDDGSGFPLIDGEAIIAADPTLIVFTDEVTYGVDDISARPGWETISAVSNGRVVQVDADIASRWGPRVVEFMEVIASVMTKADA